MIERETALAMLRGHECLACHVCLGSNYRPCPKCEGLRVVLAALALPTGAASPPGDAKGAAATLTGHPAECVCGLCLIAAASWTAGVEEAVRGGVTGTPEPDLRKSLARLLAWVPTGMCNCQGDYVCPYHEANRALAAPPPPGTAPPPSVPLGPVLSAEINALPQRVRDFIRDLETNADPAGTVQSLACAQENVAAAVVKIRELMNTVRDLRSTLKDISQNVQDPVIVRAVAREALFSSRDAAPDEAPAAVPAKDTPRDEDVPPDCGIAGCLLEKGHGGDCRDAPIILAKEGIDPKAAYERLRARVKAETGHELPPGPQDAPGDTGMKGGE